MTIPLAFEFTNHLKEEYTLEDAAYYYHPRYYSDSLRIPGLSGWTSNGRHYAEMQGELVRKTRLNREARKVSNSNKSRSIFCPFISIDTTYMVQNLFKSEIIEMKMQNIDTVIVSANKFIKQYPDFCRMMLVGDSILFDIYNANNKNDTTLYLPIRLISD